MASIEDIGVGDVLFIDRVTMATVDAMREARRRRATVFFEPNADMTGADLFEEAMGLRDIAKFSSGRFETLGNPDPDRACVLIRTNGAEGAIVSNRRFEARIPAVPVDRVVDTCGCGDATSSAILHRLVGIGLAHAPACHEAWFAADVASGMESGARYAAANCAHLGARGYLDHAGIDAVQGLIDADWEIVG